MAVKSVFPHCVRTMHIFQNLVTYYEVCTVILIYKRLANFNQYILIEQSVFVTAILESITKIC